MEMGSSGHRVTGTGSILALNCGSSSLKFGLYAAGEGEPKLICEGEAEQVGGDSSSFWFKPDAKTDRQEQKLRLSTHAEALEQALKALKEGGAPTPDAVGHRVVHGGPQVREHRKLTSEVLGQLQSAADYAPLHVPPALNVIKAVQDQMPEVAQVICLDTAFHRTMPDVSRQFALPADVTKLGVERYGFHGLSLESILAQLDPVPERMVVGHLGSGVSITAIQNGKSIDTTMGLTPTGGVMMGTRCGDLDPGVLLFLMRNGYGDPEKLEALCDHRSGLLGVSGVSSDSRELVRARANNAHADLALRMFSYQIRKAIAAMAAALDGLDLLVFTGGIGEHAEEIRQEITAGLAFLGESETKVLPAQEDLQIARITANLMHA
jgi:acetate kinase